MCQIHSIASFLSNKIGSGGGHTEKAGGLLKNELIRKQYPDFVEKSELSDQLLRILELAKDGLKFRGYGEEKFLEPLYRRAEQLTNPAREMIDGIEKGVEMREFIEKYSVL